jgi:hypothetical protein
MKGKAMYLLKEFYGKLLDEKIKITGNKNPIKMEKFLSFLTVLVTKSKSHLGACNGWTLYENKEVELYISGGIVNGSEWLDNIKFGKNLANQYNNYVNPFYLWEIISKEGLDFFLDYYAAEIAKRIDDLSNKIIGIKDELVDMESVYNKIIHRTSR